MSEHYGVYKKGWVKNISEMKQAIVGCCLNQALMMSKGKTISYADGFNGYIRSTSTQENKYKVYDSHDEARRAVLDGYGSHGSFYWTGPCNSKGYYIVHKADFSNPKYFYKWMTTEDISQDIIDVAYSIYQNFMEHNGSLK
jgi:hypothetical protein